MMRGVRRSRAPWSGADWPTRTDALATKAMTLRERVVASFAHEAAIVRRLLDTLGLPYANLTDPNVLYGRETGADVQIEREGRKVGIQVTDYAVDEGLVDQRRGLRATERRNVKRGDYPTYSLPLTHHRRAALRLRVLDKIAKAGRYAFSEYDEVWLLVGAGLARDDAAASTFPVPALLSTGDLNSDLDDGPAPLDVRARLRSRSSRRDRVTSGRVTVGGSASTFRCPAQRRWARKT